MIGGLLYCSVCVSVHECCFKVIPQGIIGAVNGINLACGFLTKFSDLILHPITNMWAFHVWQCKLCVEIRDCYEFIKFIETSVQYMSNSLKKSSLLSLSPVNAAEGSPRNLSVLAASATDCAPACGWDCCCCCCCCCCIFAIGIGTTGCGAGSCGASGCNGYAIGGGGGTLSPACTPSSTKWK